MFTILLPFQIPMSIVGQQRPSQAETGEEGGRGDEWEVAGNAKELAVDRRKLELSVGSRDPCKRFLT